MKKKTFPVKLLKRHDLNFRIRDSLIGKNFVRQINLKIELFF